MRLIVEIDLNPLGGTYHDHEEAYCGETVKELVAGDRDLIKALMKEALQ